MSTFQKEISFISPTVFNQELNNGLGAFEEKEITKLATFKELSRVDKDQRKLQAMLMSVFKSKGESELQIDYDSLVDITEKAVDCLLIIDEVFTASDKINFLNDNGAVIVFGMWLLSEKITPFFSVLIPK